MTVSVVIRTQNEAKWLERCLVGVLNQDHTDLEVIVVDSGSTDGTIDIAKRHPVRLLHYDGPYFPGRSLNMGAKASKGDYIAFLSAHCIPVNDKWIERLLINFMEPEVAGVYGRQEPLPDSSAIDKRDLWTVFGKERRVQLKDYFFHNANSMVRRSDWSAVPFDETLPSIEDQAWAKAMTTKCRAIIYEPHASVHHFHGIHQNLDKDRAERVVKVIQLLKDDGGAW
jgi:glycosyltransferase involved in cell wall biosynthesis